MMFRNPWIDPRVAQVRPDEARAYLLQRSWQPLPSSQPHFLDFRGPSDGDEPPVVRVPLLEQARDYPQRIIELITDLALAENRPAVEVLNDILRHSTDGTPANGAGQRQEQTAPPT